jgi:SSS family transporter
VENNYFLIIALVVYLGLNVIVGFWAARRVKNSSDFLVAGHHLPLYMVVTTTFATWFGSETVLGTSSTFLKEGLGGIVADPFGASLCLILVGLFFAVPLYRLKLLTIGDFYRRRFGRDIEVLTSIVIALSYLGWVAAQLSAMGLVFNIVTHGLVSVTAGVFIGVTIVLFYTMMGGMWSVAMTDFINNVLLVSGLLFITWLITGKVAGGAHTVIHSAQQAGKMNFFPENSWSGWLGFISALMTLGFGSIPQQDIYQRVLAANTANNARRGAVIGGICYFLFAMLPIYLAYTAFIIDPNMVNAALGPNGNSQMVLPNLIIQNTPMVVQVLFFGALLSAIMSTSSATLLAPSGVISENLLSGIYHRLSSKSRLWFIRATVFVFAIFVTAYALATDKSIFQMVENAYKVVLVGAFAPLAFGLYWKRASLNGARLSILLGVSVWLAFEALDATWGTKTGWAILGYSTYATVCPPQLAGFIASVVGMLFGSLVWPNTNPPLQPLTPAQEAAEI